MAVTLLCSKMSYDGKADADFLKINFEINIFYNVHLGDHTTLGWGSGHGRGRRTTWRGNKFIQGGWIHIIHWATSQSWSRVNYLSGNV